MKKQDSGPAKKPVEETANKQAKIGSVEIEALAHNVARLVEEGGKALAAYMKPREEGKIKSEAAEDIADMVKTIGQILEYWLSDPERALQLQTSLGRAFSTCTRSRPNAWPAKRRSRRPRPIRRTSASPIRTGRKTSSSISSSSSICSPCNGPRSWCATPRSTSTRGRRLPSTSSRSPTRSRRRISSSPTPSCCARRSIRRRKTWCAACTCSPRTSRPGKASQDHAIGASAPSRSAAISRSLPAR